MVSFLEFVDKYLFVFSLLYTIIVRIVGFVTDKVRLKVKKYQIRKCLSLTKAECKIILPSYYKCIHNDNSISV